MKHAHILYYIVTATLFLGIHRGKLALWKAGDPYPQTVYPCSVTSLPEADRALLEEGIPIRSREELTARLEDLLS